MTSQGPNHPTVSYNGGWTNYNNVKSSDNNYATFPYSFTVTSPAIQAYNFGFTIPTNATINGFLVEIERKGSDNASSVYSRDSSVHINKILTNINGTGTNKADTLTKYTTSDSIASYGGSDDLWGDTWSPSDVNNSQFGIYYKAYLYNEIKASNIVYVDNMQITVYYTELTPVARPFAVNTGSAIPGTTQVYNLAIGVDAYDYSNYGGVTWYMGPDENLGYVIAKDSGTQPTFWRTKIKNDAGFINLVNSIRKIVPGYTTIGDCTTWLASNSYYTDYPV